MTPQEKAKEIYDQMKGFKVSNKHRKKCAKVAASHLIENSAFNMDEDYKDDLDNPHLYENYWCEVFREIEKL